jgi:hypothetical protein
MKTVGFLSYTCMPGTIFLKYTIWEHRVQIVIGSSKVTGSWRYAVSVGQPITEELFTLMGKFKKNLEILFSQNSSMCPFLSNKKKRPYLCIQNYNGNYSSI